MSALIDQLKAEHKIVLALMDEATKVLGDVKETGQKLIKIKSGLLGHLKKEDEYLYPALLRIAPQNPQLDALLSVFGNDMMIVSKTAIEFLDKYSGNATGAEFRRELGVFSAALRRRIANEERLLYPEFERLNVG